MVDQTVINEYIKDRLEGGVNNLLWTGNFLLNRLRATNIGVTPGNYSTKLKARVGANQGVAQSSVVPRSGKTKTIDKTIAMKKTYAFLEVDGDAVAYAPNDLEVAFMGAVAGETASLMDSINRNFEVAFFGKGDGVRATIESVAGGPPITSIVLNEPVNMEWFELGLIIDTYNNAGGAHRTRYEITAVTSATRTLTVTEIASTTDPDADDYVTNQREYNSCFMGFLGFCDDGTELTTLHGIDSSTYELWRARVDENGGANRPIDTDMLDQTIIWGNRSGGFDLVVTTEDLMVSIANLINAHRQWVNVTELKGGFQGLSWAGKEVYADMFAKLYNAFFINSNKVEIRQMKGTQNNVFGAMKWDSMGTGKDYFTRVLVEGSVEKYQSLIRADFQTVTTDRKSQARIGDVE